MKTLSRGLSLLTLLAWSALLLYFYFSGRLNEYLIPAYRPLVMIAGFAMLGIAGALAWGLHLNSRFQGTGGLLLEDRGDDLASPNRVRATQALAFGMLVLPVWAAVGVSKDQFNVTTMINRGIVSDASQLPGKSSLVVPPPLPSANQAQQPASYEPPLPGATPIPADNSALDSSQYLKKTADGHIVVEVTDLLFASDDDSMRPALEGKTVEIIGQYMPAKGDTVEGRFQLLRMFMVCCAADARPVAIAIQPSKAQLESKGKLNELGWIRVTGKLEFPVENGRRVPLVEAANAVPCDPPSEAMLY